MHNGVGIALKGLQPPTLFADPVSSPVLVLCHYLGPAGIDMLLVTPVVLMLLVLMLLVLTLHRAPPQVLAATVEHYQERLEQAIAAKDEALAQGTASLESELAGLKDERDDLVQRMRFLERQIKKCVRAGG